jgi:hypothetical protein
VDLIPSLHDFREPWAPGTLCTLHSCVPAYKNPVSYQKGGLDITRCICSQANADDRKPFGKRLNMHAITGYKMLVVIRR